MGEEICNLGAVVLASTPGGCLEADNVLGLQALRARFHLELHCLSFVQGLIPFRLYGRKVHEDILTGLALDETVTLAGVKPLHCSLFSHF